MTRPATTVDAAMFVTAMNSSSAVHSRAATRSASARNSGAASAAAKPQATNAASGSVIGVRADIDMRRAQPRHRGERERDEHRQLDRGQGEAKKRARQGKLERRDGRRQHHARGKRARA